MGNIAKWLIEAEQESGETIEAIVVGRHDSARYDAPADAGENIILSREAGLAKLGYEYDDGFGCADCHPLYAWPYSRVYLMAEYDGATSLVWVPRSPAAIKPHFDGQRR